MCVILRYVTVHYPHDVCHPEIHYNALPFTKRVILRYITVHYPHDVCHPKIQHSALPP